MGFLAPLLSLTGFLLLVFAAWFLSDVLGDVPARVGTVRSSLKPLAYFIRGKLLKARRDRGL